MGMATRLFRYDCDRCGEQVTVSEDPRNSPPLVCPDCSAVEIDYTVDPESYEETHITQL